MNTPTGLLATTALASEPVAAPAAARGAPSEDTSPPNSSLDPNYVEPLGLADFAERMVAVAAIYGPDSLAHLLIADLLARVVMLEEALKPFAMQGMSMTHARMVLMSEGRNDPAGGTWVSQLKQIRCLPNEVLFYNAIDAYGRGATEEAMEQLFTKAAAVAEAAREKEARDKDGAVSQ